jgi:hydroxymethylbilane synthase
VGSRRSKLALAQTRQVLESWQRRAGEAGVRLEFELREIVTKGDKILDVTLSKVGGKGLFVKEIEQALLDREIDVAVHSMKDVPAELPDGLVLGAVPEREDPRDVIVVKDGRTLAELPAGSVIGTSSLRRACQLRAFRPDLRVEWIRGNIDTRLAKLEAGDYDAILLAAAGLSRLGWKDRITEYLPVERCLPAVGQGALALECRADDEPLREWLAFIHDPVTARETAAERAFLARLEGGCQVPIGAHARVRRASGDPGGADDGNLPVLLTGMVGEPDGSAIIRDSLEGTDPSETGRLLAERLLAQGGEEILKRTGM